MTAEQLRAHERSENEQARRILAREQATHTDPTMVDPETSSSASTRPEAPSGESEHHDTDSYVGPYTPKTGDSSSEDELDYKGLKQDMEYKLYAEEYKKAAKEYAQLRKEHAAIASGETPDDKIAQHREN